MVEGISWPANCAGVKIDLWSNSNTAEISLKYLTCFNKLGATISYVCSPCWSLLSEMFFEIFPDVSQVVKHAVVHLSAIKPYIVFFPNQKEGSTFLPPFSGSQIWFHLKNLQETRLSSSGGCHHKRLLICWMRNCVSGAAPALWAWLCCSADWQVRRQVTDKAARSAANGRAGGWGRNVTLLPRQPPLNECVHGMWPDWGYITGWGEGWGSGGGAIKGAVEKGTFFFHSPLFIYILQLHFVSQQEFYPTKTLKYVTYTQKVYVDRKCRRIFKKNPKSLFSG